MENILYLEKMGMNNEKLNDIKNHRVRVIEYIPTIICAEPVFFEFSCCDMHKMRYTNKRTGKQLKHPKWETVNPCGLHIDTQIDKTDGTSWRLCNIERAVWDCYYDYTCDNILKVVNTYSTIKYNKVVFVEDKAEEIAKKGGYREREIVSGDHYCKIAQWDNSYKIVEIVSRVNNKNDKSCLVNILNNTIVG